MDIIAILLIFNKISKPVSFFVIVRFNLVKIVSGLFRFFIGEAHV